MEIKKINTDSPEKDAYLNIPAAEIRAIHKKIVQSYDIYLKAYNVTPLWTGLISEDCTDEEFVRCIGRKELQLIFLYKYINCFVHKDMVSAFVRKYHPDAALDQQVRHLGTQDLWYVLNKGSHVPNTDMTVPSGYNYLVSIELPNPRAIEKVMRRAGRLAAHNFEELKYAYSNQCATCGITEGQKDPRNEEIVSLQQGHMNPRLPLSLENTIPQCQYCNQTYRDYFQFNEYGRVIAVNNPRVLLKSPKDVQDEMIAVLLAERTAKE